MATAAGAAIRTVVLPGTAGTRWCGGSRRPASRGDPRTPAGRRRRRAHARAARRAWPRSPVGPKPRRRPPPRAAGPLRPGCGRTRSRAGAPAAPAPRPPPPVDQDAGERLRGRGMVGLELEGLTQRCLVARRNERVRLAGRRRQPLDERGHLGLGQRPDELVHHLAVAQGEDGGDRLHPEGLGDPRVLVHVDLGQLHCPPGVGHGLLEHGTERRARPAPGGPEVHDHRHRRAAVHDIGLEGLIGDVHRPRR